MKKLMMMAALAMLSACADTETAPFDVPDAGDELDVRDVEEDPAEDPGDEPDVDEDADTDQDTDADVEEDAGDDADVEEDVDGGSDDEPPAEAAVCLTSAYDFTCITSDYSAPTAGNTALRWGRDCRDRETGEAGVFVDCEADGRICVSGVGCLPPDDVTILDCGNTERERICNSSVDSISGIQYCDQGVAVRVGLCPLPSMSCSSAGLDNDSRCVLD